MFLILQIIGGKSRKKMEAAPTTKDIKSVDDVPLVNEGKTLLYEM